MENHPIPQDVTGFKFRLIGSITLKQFLYLLGAGAIALVFWFLPISIFIKIPIILISGGIGMAFAFVPIDGRPMDKMLYNFAKTLPAENQYLYHKKGAEMIYFSYVPPARAKQSVIQAQDQKITEKAQLFNKLSKAYFKADPEEEANIASISNLFQEGTVPAQGFTNRVIKADGPAPLPKTVITPTPVNPASPVMPAEIKPIPEKMVEPHIPPTQMQTSQTSTSGQPQTVQGVTSIPVAKSIGGSMPSQATPPIPQMPTHIEAPNVIQGVVKDPRGKVLPHIIVEVLDANNIPVRAFRTNQNGNFAAATALPNGTYTIHLEDSLKKQHFEDVITTLSGQLLQPLVITSTDEREKLRRELFGGAVAT